FILIFVAGLAAPFFLDDYAEEKLIEEFSNQTDDRFQLDFSDLQIGFWKGSLTVDSIVIAPKNASGFKVVSATKLVIGDISWLSFWNKPKPDFGSIFIKEPVFELYSRDFSSLSFSEFSSGEDSAQTNYPDIDFSIENGTVKILYPKGGEEFSLENFNLDLQQLNLNAIINNSSDHYLRDFSFSGEDLTYMMEDILYSFTIDEFDFQSSAQLFSVGNFAMTPILPKYEFSKIRSRQLDRYDVEVAEMMIKGFEPDSLFSGIVELDSLIVREGKMEIFRDKNKPKAPGISTKPLVNDMAKKIRFPFAVNVAVVSNSSIVYEEHKPPSEKSGHISFEDLEATLSNFRSATHPDFNETTLTLHVETYFMGASLLNVDVHYPIFNEDNTHYLKAHLESINPQEASEMLENVGFVRVEDGIVHELSAEMELNENSSSGEVTLLYSDLNVSMLDENDPDKNGIKEQVSNFIANTFVIKTNNLPEDPRIGTFEYERDPEKSIFAYWWKSLQSGLEASIR
ncbi:MAG: hypothetical protein WD597_00590, partial [Balneolaceae bacterium]